MRFVWMAGRQLSAATNSSGVSCNYSYNDDGIRYKKIVGDVTTNYYLDGSTVLAESRSNGTKIIYRHDESGNYVGFTLNGVEYYYIYNAQGDVVALVDTYGAVAAKYYYDAWGKLIKVTNASGVTITSSTHVGNINPIRYRGYYYDVETGLYYLQSRYYDPTVGRFINADGINIDNTNIHAYNLYSYCYNDPINNVDPTGYIVGIDDITIITLVGCMVILSGIAAISALGTDNNSADFAHSWYNPFANVQVSLVLFVATVSPSVVDSPAFSPTVYTRTKSSEKSDSVAISTDVAISKSKSKVEYQYWEAWLVGNKLVVGEGLNYLEAQLEVMMGNNLMCANQQAAFSILFNLGYINMVGPERSGGENGDGFFWHYHPNRSSKAHIWYYS